MKKLLLLLIFFNLHLFATQNIKEVQIVSESWEDLTNKDGTGLYFDITRAIYEPLGIKVKIKLMPYNRSMSMVEKRQADAWLGSWVDEVAYAIYPKHYFDQDIVTAMYKKDKFPNFQGLESLKNKNVGWMRGYGYDEYLDESIVIHERNDRKSLLLSLEKDRFDFFLDDKDDMQEAINHIKFNTAKYTFLEIMKFKLYPAFRSDRRGKELKQIWDERFKILLKDGTLKKIYINNEYKELFLY